jgi:hypothetical protein
MNTTAGFATSALSTIIHSEAQPKAPILCLVPSPAISKSGMRAFLVRILIAGRWRRLRGQYRLRREITIRTLRQRKVPLSMQQCALAIEAAAGSGLNLKNVC